jgi:hypothetical protein
MNNKNFSLIIVLFLLMLVACNTQPEAQAPAEPSTPVYIPVLVTVEIPVPVTVTPTVEPSQPISTDTASLVQTVSYENLEENSEDWDVYEEGTPFWVLQNVDSPSQDGKSLQCSITGGSPYSNAHCYINIAVVTEANSFKLSLDFQFTPITTCNNQVSPSVVQAIEFTMNKWENPNRYEFAVQWQNVGDGAPQWRYWDGSRSGDERWVPINSNTNYCLTAEQWHTLALEGDIVDEQIHYKSFSIDNFTYNLDLMVSPVSTPNEDDRLAVAVQVDGNESQSPYDLFIDNVNFIVQRHVDCREIDAEGEAEFNFQFVDTFITTIGIEGFVVNKETKITWAPACLMDLQYYWNGIDFFNEKDAVSGQYDLSEVPTGEEIEIKIWRGGNVIKQDIWVRVRE